MNRNRVIPNSSAAVAVRIAARSTALHHASRGLLQRSPRRRPGRRAARGRRRRQTACHRSRMIASRRPSPIHPRISCFRSTLPILSAVMIRFAVFALSLLLTMTPTWARSSSHSSGRSSSSSSRSVGSHKRSSSSKKCATCIRGANGRIKRSPEARRQFIKLHPCPSTGKTSGACKGYVVDHIVPLKRGGADDPSNMQWQTTAAAKAKDKIE